jgi:hypothetical protein
MSREMARESNSSRFRVRAERRRKLPDVAIVRAFDDGT